MFKNIHNNGEFISHAFLLEEHGQTVEELFKFLEDIGFTTKGNPDLWHREFDSFGIDEGRELREIQAKGAFSNGKRIFIIQAKVVTPEAQNALLKTFEEPTANTHIFLIVPNKDLLLPTLLSRLMFIDSDTGENVKKDTLVDEFMAATPPERIVLLKEIIEEKDRPRATAFLDGLEGEYAKKGLKQNEIIEFLETLIEFKKYLAQRGSAVKMILEHIALTAPKI
ncbi:MAG TPA: hypothetical protein ENI66_02185 [Candidatus Yonathbacteria bacterium]|nr:hypothetical protein [Candidatus Yonathbacteria bacterium]